MDLMEAALAVKHNAERIERKRFQRRYGAFWKCACGRFLGPLVRVFKAWPPSDEEILDRITKRLEDGIGDAEARRVWNAMGRP